MGAPLAARGTILLGALAVAILGLLRAWPRVDPRQIALAVEHEFAELGQRVQTVVDYARPGPETVPASPGLVKALLHETDERTFGLDYQRVVPWRDLRRGLAVLGLTLIPGILALLFSPGLRTAVLRTLLVPAHYTTLEVDPGDVVIHDGDRLEVAVTLAGRPVRQRRWLHREAGSSGEWTAADLVLTGEKAAQRAADWPAHDDTGQLPNRYRLPRRGGGTSKSGLPCPGRSPSDDFGARGHSRSTALHAPAQRHHE